MIVRQPWFQEASTLDEQRTFWNFALGRPYKERVTTYLRTAAVSHLMRRMDRRAAQVAEDLGVEQVDLMDVLEQSARTFYDELHFTPEGAEAVGQAVASAVLAGGVRVSGIRLRSIPPEKMPSLAPGRGARAVAGSTGA